MYESEVKNLMTAHRLVNKCSNKRMVSRWAFWPVLQHSLNHSVMLLNWVKANNAVHTPMPIHRLCTQTFSPPQKTNALQGIEPAAPPPSQSPSWDVNPLHQSTTRKSMGCWKQGNNCPLVDCRNHCYNQVAAKKLSSFICQWLILFGVGGCFAIFSFGSIFQHSGMNEMSK